MTASGSSCWSVACESWRLQLPASVASRPARLTQAGPAMNGWRVWRLSSWPAGVNGPDAAETAPGAARSPL